MRLAETQAGPWWVGSLKAASTVAAVRFRLPSDSASFAVAVAGAKVMVSNTTWAGRSSIPDFLVCGRVPSTVARGQTVTVECNLPAGMTVQHVAIVVPYAKTVSLSLCEVDIVTQASASSAAASAPAAAPRSAGRRLLAA